MNKTILAVATAATLASTVATAQPYSPYSPYARDYYSRDRDSDRDGRPDWMEWNRDRDRDGRPDQYDRYDNRAGHRYGMYARHHFYGPGYGYSGYQGSWRAGQRFPYYRNDRYVIEDYRVYGLPPPRAGYRYYRTDNGDVVMVAIATGIIGLIAAQALNDRDDRYDHYSYYRR